MRTSFLRKYRQLPLFLILLMMGVVACSKQGTTPEALPTIVVDEKCQGLLNNTFISSTSFLLGETDQGPLYGPKMVAFLLDGRVVWKYSLTSYIGEFTCEDGVFEAIFSEGDQKTFEGTYSIESDTIRIEDVSYMKATEE